MRRGLLRVSVVLVLAAGAALPLGCAVLELSLGDGRKTSSFWDGFDPSALVRKYEAALAPCSSWGSGTNTCSGPPGSITKHLAFDEVRQGETRLAEVLASLHRDLVELIKASGAELQGEARLTLDKGVLRKFELDYRQGPVKGGVRGEVRPSEKAGGWDLVCLVWERSPALDREPAPELWGPAVP
jgi:hypothetical protein